MRCRLAHHGPARACSSGHLGDLPVRRGHAFKFCRCVQDGVPASSGSTARQGPAEGRTPWRALGCQYGPAAAPLGAALN
jgi:hypothetical protein